MLKFELHDATVRLAHLNLRAEKHGEDSKPAIDLKLQAQLANTELAMFDPALAGMLYEQTKTPAQEQIEGVPPIMTALRFQHLKPLKWDVEGTGYTLTIAHGLAGKSDLILTDCTVDHFQIDAMEGGTVEVTFRVQTSKIDERAIGKLGLLVNCDLDVSLKGPTIDELNRAPAQDPGADAAWPFPNEPKDKAGKGNGAKAQHDATGAFLDQHGTPA